MSKVGWIGLGNMGYPMSMNLLKAGNEVVGYDVVDKKADLEAAGASWATSPKAVAEAADFIFTMVPNGKVLQIVTLGENGVVAGLSPGKIVIDMSTVSVAESLVVNDAIEAKGCKFLRAPVTGSTALAAAATIGVLASGDKETYEKVFPLFEALSSKQTYLGGAEESRVMKLALNLMIATTMQMQAEAVVMAEKAGLDVAQVCDMIAGSAVGSPLTGYKAKLIAEGEYAPAFSVNMMIKDVDLALDVAKQYGVSMESTELTKNRLQLAADRGYGEKDFAVLVKLLEEESGYTR